MAVKKIEEALSIKDKLLKRFKAEGEFNIDLGDGCILECRVPTNYVEKAKLEADVASNFVATHGMEGDPNIYIAEQLAAVITNLNAGEIKELVENCPDLISYVQAEIEAHSGVVSRILQKESLEEARKKSKLTETGEQS